VIDAAQACRPTVGTYPNGRPPYQRSAPTPTVGTHTNRRPPPHGAGGCRGRLASAIRRAYAHVQTARGFRLYHGPLRFHPRMNMTDSTLAFVFPGQGSQSLGMLAELAEL